MPFDDEANAALSVAIVAANGVVALVVAPMRLPDNGQDIGAAVGCAGVEKDRVGLNFQDAVSDPFYFYNTITELEYNEHNVLFPPQLDNPPTHAFLYRLD
jgi:hypothetical protein